MYILYKNYKVFISKLIVMFVFYLIIGIRHQLGIATCKCEPFAVSLARLRMWPTSSKQPTYALSFDLLDWMETMLLECQVSLNDFCKALNNKLPKYVIVSYLLNIYLYCILHRF